MTSSTTPTPTKTATSSTTKPPRQLPNPSDPLPYFAPLPPADVVTKCVDPGMMALTFDDGPFDYTNTLLDVLRQEQVTATFFVGYLVA